MKKPVTSVPQNFSAQDVYKHADAFYFTIDHLHRSVDRAKYSIMVPIVVLSAFASELLLKCLLHVERGETPRVHLLYDLFLELTPETQSRLEGLWDEIAVQRKAMLDQIDAQLQRKLPRDLRSNLQMGSDAFRLVRYVYEGGQDFEYVLSDLPIILKKRIQELKPEWS